MTMSILFGANAAKLLRHGGVTLLQPVGEIIINARVLFLQGDRQRQNLLLCEALKCFHQFGDNSAFSRPESRLTLGSTAVLCARCLPQTEHRGDDILRYLFYVLGGCTPPTSK